MGDWDKFILVHPIGPFEWGADAVEWAERHLAGLQWRVVLPRAPEDVEAVREHRKEDDE